MVISVLMTQLLFKMIWLLQVNSITVFFRTFYLLAAPKELNALEVTLSYKKD